MTYQDSKHIFVYIIDETYMLRYDCDNLGLNNDILGQDQTDMIDTIRQRKIKESIIIFYYHDVSRQQTYIRVHY